MEHAREDTAQLNQIVLITFFSAAELLSKVLSQWLLQETSVLSALRASAYARHDASARRRAPPSRAFDIALTVASPSPDKITVEWTPKDAIEGELNCLSK